MPTPGDRFGGHHLKVSFSSITSFYAKKHSEALAKVKTSLFKLVAPNVQ